MSEAKTYLPDTKQADFPQTANRTALLLGLRIVREPLMGRVPTRKRAIGDAFAVGAVLTEVVGNSVAALPSPIDGLAPGPVKYIALEAFDGTDGTEIAVKEFNATTRIVGQIWAGSAGEAEIGQRGRITGSATTGLYAVNLQATDNPCLEVTSVEPLDYPFEPRANGNYNLVEFRILSAALAIAPVVVS